MNQKGIIKAVIFIIIIIIIVVGSYFAYQSYRQYRLNMLMKSHALEQMDSENFPVIGDSIIIEGKLGSEKNGTKDVLVYYKPGTKKQTFFSYKKCQGSNEKCQGLTGATFIYLLDSRNRFLVSSSENKIVRITGLLSEEQTDSGAFGPIVEINKLEILE